MDTKELMTKKSRVREAMDWMTGPPPADTQPPPGDDRMSELQQQLRRAGRKLDKLETQKQNLSETCASQDAYIAQLAREFETLQTSKSQMEQELESLRSRQSDSVDLSDTISGLHQELEEARTKIRWLEETAQTQQMEADRQRDGLEAALREKDEQIRQLMRQSEQAASQLQEVQARIRQFEQFEEAAQSQQAEAGQHSSHLESALREKTAQFERLSQQYEEITGQLQEALDGQQRMERENYDLHSRLAEVTGQMDVFQVQKELTEQELAELRGLHTAAADHQSMIAQLHEQLERSRSSQRQLEETLRLQQGDHEREKALLGEKLIEKEKLFQKIAEQRDQISLELEDLQAAHNRVKKEYTELHRRLTDTEDQCKTLQAQSGKTEEQLRELQAQQEKAAEQQKQIEQMTAELEQAREKIRSQEEVLQSREKEQAGVLVSVRQQLHDTERNLNQLHGQKELADQRQKIIDRLGSDLEESRSRIRQLEETLQGRQEEYTLKKASLETDVHENQTRCRTLSAKLNEAQQTRQRLESESQALRTRLEEQASSSEKAVREMEESRSYVAALQQEGLRREQETEQLRQTLRETEQKLESQNRTVGRAEQQAAQMQSEINDLRNCFQKVLEEKVALRKQLTALEEFETKFLTAEEVNHQLGLELEDVRFRLDEKTRLLERAASADQENRQRQHELQEKLQQKNGLLDQLQQQEEHLLRQIEDHSQTIERARLAHQQLREEMELQQQEFEKQCRLRDDQIDSLRTRLAEVSNQAKEFERLSIQAHAESNTLRETLSRTEEQLTATQARLTQQEEQNKSMQKQIAQLQITVDQLAETRSELQKARRHIDSLEQTVCRQSSELEMTQKQLSKHLEFARELQILGRKSEGIWEVPQIRPAEPPKPDRPAPKPQAPQTEKENQFDEETEMITEMPEASEAIPDELNSRTALLRNQLTEQTENLKRAHETIRLLREQKDFQPTGRSGEQPEVSWISKPPAERQTRDAVRQFLVEQESRGFRKQPASPKPAPVPVPAAPINHEPTPQAEPELDEKTKSMFRKFGLLGGWSADKK